MGGAEIHGLQMPREAHSMSFPTPAYQREPDAGFSQEVKVVIKGFERLTVDLEDSASRARVALENLNPVSLFSEP